MTFFYCIQRESVILVYNLLLLLWKPLGLTLFFQFCHNDDNVGRTTMFIPKNLRLLLIVINENIHEIKIR